MTEDTDLLSRRLVALEDRVAISELMTVYNESWDDGRLEDWVATWTDDGTFVMPGAPDTTGNEALLQMVRAMQEVGFVHISANARVILNGDSAQHHCYGLLGRRSPTREAGSSTWVTTGRYTDQLVRTTDGWRFARRVFAADSRLSGLPKWW